MENKRKQKLVGEVVSVSGDKTIIVSITTYRVNPLYGKRYKHTVKYPAHDEANTAKLGDKVRIIETRPISKTKRFRLLEVVEEAIIL